jgi:1-acyl-sn-glycerol-3-phosphate acyltransferase
VDDWKMEPARDLGLSGLERLGSLKRESGLVESMGRLLAWTGLRVGFWLYNRLEIHGREYLPKEAPFVLVANHASHLDALVLTTVLPLAWRDHVFPIGAADKFFGKRSLAWVVTTLLNVLPITRKTAGRHALKELRQRLHEPPSIFILFPEGARTRDGTMLPFKPGVGMMIGSTAAPVVPCYLQGTLEAGPAGAMIPRPHKIVIRIGPPHDFSSVPDDRHGWQHVAQTLQTAVGALGGVPVQAGESSHTQT